RPAPAAAADVRREDEDELAQELRERLRDSVRAHLIADVPVGVLLSGGVDSCTLPPLPFGGAGSGPRDSVRAHLIADVPVGVLLSGGIDSCTLAALASEQAGRVSTFTIGFDEREFAERSLARIVSKRYGPAHHGLVLRPAAVELLPQLAEAFDEPFADSSAIPTFLVSSLARARLKVAPPVV